MKNLFIIFLCLTVGTVSAQINGKIYDAVTMEPINGATVKYSEQTSGTITDSNGSFKLPTSPIKVLQISSIGYQTMLFSDMDVNEQINIALEPLVENLQQIVVTGNREAALRTMTPMAISKISPKLIDETKATSVYEIINKTPGVLMGNLNNEQHMMAIRQPMSTSAYFLYLEDGVPIRPMGVFNHNALLEMNQFTISSIEVVKGPVSSIYGPEAVGGAINFISQRPTGIPSARVGIQADQWGYKRLQYGVGAMKGKFGVYVGGLISDQQNSWLARSDYKKNSQYARAEYHFSQNLRLISTFTYNDYDSQTSGSVDSVAFYSRAYLSNNNFTYRNSKALRGRITLEKDWQKGSHSFFTIFARKNEMGQNPSYGIRWRTGSETATGQINLNTFKSIGFITQHSQQFEFLNSKLTAGLNVDISPNSYWAHQIDLYAKLREGGKSVEMFTISKERPDIQLASYDSDIFNKALYAQYDFNLTKNLRLSAGVRYDNMSFTYLNNLDVDKVTGDAIGGSKAYYQTTPKLGLTYDLGKSKGLFANFSRGFAPNGLTAIFRKRTTPSETGELFYYNLSPALFNNAEIGGWAAFSANKLYIDWSVYRMNGKNELLNIRQADNSYDYQAAGKTLHQGLELGLNYKVNNQINTRFGGTYSEHKFVEFVLSQKENDLQDVNGNFMPSAPKYIWNTEITYKPNCLPNFRTAIEWQHVGESFQNQSNVSIAKGYNFLNLRLAYKIKGFELFSNIMNLTDALYATRMTSGNSITDLTSYTPSAPRTFLIGLQFNISGN